MARLRVATGCGLSPFMHNQSTLTNNNFGQKIPDYHMWDLKLNSHYQGWTADVSLNNVLDEKAMDYAIRSTTKAGKYNAQPLPERNITLSVSYNFN